MHIYESFAHQCGFNLLCRLKGSRASSFSATVNSQNGLQSTNLCSHQQYLRILISSIFPPNLVLSDQGFFFFLLLTNWMGDKCNFFVSISFSLITFEIFLIIWGFPLCMTFISFDHLGKCNFFFKKSSFLIPTKNRIA